MKYDLSQPNTLSATRSEGECTAALFRNTQSAHLCTSSAQQWYTSVISNTPCIFCAFNHCVEYYLWFCNHPSCACVCVSWNLSFPSVFGQSMCMVLYCVLCVWSSIHLYLIWSGTIGGTMCEREALSIRMGGGQHIELGTTVLGTTVLGNTVVGNTVVVGNTSGSTPESSGGNENHYVAIDHPLLKESHHYFTLHITLQLKRSEAQKERCQTHHDET